MVNVKNVILGILVVALSALLIGSASADAPTSADKTVTATEDTAYPFAAADFAFTDADAGDTLKSVRITALTAVGKLQLNSVDVALNQQGYADIPAADITAGNFKFVPVLNGNGASYASFPFKVVDNTDAVSTSAYTITIAVTAVNDVPTSANKAITATEDTPYALTIGGTAPDFAFTDVDGDLLSKVQITMLPAVGSLTLDGVAIASTALPKDITAADITAGKLKFNPVANGNGANYATFKFKVNDGSADYSTEYTITISVTAVNDAPVFTTYDFSDLATLREGSAFSFQLVAADTADADTSLIYSMTVSPALGSLAVNSATGLISGTLSTDSEGAYTATLTVSDGETPALTDTETVSFRVKEQYEDGVLEIDKVTFTDLSNDASRHYPGDTIEIEVKLLNNDDALEMEDITVYIACDDLGIDETVDVSYISSDDSETAVLEIELPVNADEGTHYFDISAKGKDEDGHYHSATYFENADFDSKSLGVRRSNHDVIISDISLSPSEVDAGDTVTVKVTAANIGKNREDNVKITLKNSELKIDKVSEPEDLRMDADDETKFTITIPETAATKEYTLEATVAYDGSGEDEDDTPMSETIVLKVTGSGSGTTPSTPTPATGNAALTTTTPKGSAAQGKAAKYELTLKNNAADTVTYDIKLSGITDWATYRVEAGGETGTVSLPAGASIPVYVYVTPKSDASVGDHTATVSIYSGASVLTSQLLTTAVSAGTGTSTTITGAGVTFQPSSSAVAWIVLGVVAIFGIAVAAYTIYKLKRD